MRNVRPIEQKRYKTKDLKMSQQLLGQLGQMGQNQEYTEKFDAMVAKWGKIKIVITVLLLVYAVLLLIAYFAKRTGITSGDNNRIVWRMLWVCGLKVVVVH